MGIEMENRKELFEKYNAKEDEIRGRIYDFSKIKKMGDGVLLSELCFCICAANSSAEAAWKAQIGLVEKELLYSNSRGEISQVLLNSGVRFHNNKAKYIIEARKKLFEEGKLGGYLQSAGDEGELRNMLAKEITGLGMKEASHFLRNTGLGKEIAILDRHILKNLEKYGAIGSIPKSLSDKQYIEIEGKMRKFAERIKIPMEHLDLLFWSEETGIIFK
ncbi:MAG: N-glycosylase/DNA lyase [Candidatus Micrarchaeota archaeon]